MYVIVLVVSAVILAVVYYIFKCRGYSLDNEHLLITGGSSGIGLALAIEGVKRGASVTLIARNKERLVRAQELVQKQAKKDQKVLIFVADVTAGVDSLEDVVKKAQDDAGPITCLINCAGTCKCNRFDEAPIDEFQHMMNINYFGSVYMTRAALPHMKSRRKGKIIFVSSLSGLVGFYGLTAYSASKFALTGMAQALQMEVAPYGITVTVSFPPDTDTPGFAEENKSKPLETQLICETAGLYTASAVAAKILKDSVNEQFMSSVAFEGWMMCTLCSGMSPVSSLGQLIVQVLTMGALRVIGCVYRAGCERTIERCMTEDKNKHD